MIISNKFLNAAENALQERVIKKMYRELSTIFPADFGDEESGIKVIVTSRKEAAQMRVLTEKGIFTWVALRHLLGADFFAHSAWVEYLAAAGKTGDYAICEFLSALNEEFSIASPDDVGFGLSEAAFDKLPQVVELAKEIIISKNRIAELVGVEGGRQYFLQTTPSVIIRNPYNAKIAELRRAIKGNEAAIQKASKPAQDLNHSVLLQTIENMNLQTSIEAAETKQEDVQVQQATLKAHEQKLSELQQKLADEQAQSAKPIAQLVEKIKGLMRQAELLKAQRN